MPINRRPGRPRDPNADNAILRAALKIFIENGIDAVTIEEIARRAGVGRSTVYRRWSSKEQLLAQAIESARESIAPTQTLARLAPAIAQRDFVRNLLDAGVELWGRKQIRDLTIRLVGAQLDCPQLQTVYWNTYVEPRWKLFTTLLERMRKQGSLPKNTDVEVLAHMIGGAMIYRLLFMPVRGEWSRARIRAYLIRLIRQAGFSLNGASR